MKQLTIINLLENLIEYHLLWDYDECYYSKSSIARRKQIDCLRMVFNLEFPEHSFLKNSSITKNGIKLNDTIKYFSNGYDYILLGGFLLLEFNYPYNDLINERIDNLLKKYYEGYTHACDLNCEELPEVFEELLDFKRSVYFMKHNLNKPENTNKPLIDFKSKFINAKIKSFTKEIKEVDEFLAWILDPYNRSFSANEINYPQYNLEKLDKEFFEK